MNASHLITTSYGTISHGWPLFASFLPFDNVQRHALIVDGNQRTVMVTELSPVQRQILRLLGHPPEQYGR